MGSSRSKNQVSRFVPWTAASTYLLSSVPIDRSYFDQKGSVLSPQISSQQLRMQMILWYCLQFTNNSFCIKKVVIVEVLMNMRLSIIIMKVIIFEKNSFETS